LPSRVPRIVFFRSQDRDAHDGGADAPLRNGGSFVEPPLAPTLLANRKCLACTHKQPRASACYISHIDDSEFTQRDTFFVLCSAHPVFPAPSVSMEGERNWKLRAYRAAIVNPYSVVIAREGGRPSIPETPMIESRSRGVLDSPVKPGDGSLYAATSWIASRSLSSSAQSRDLFARNDGKAARL